MLKMQNSRVQLFVLVALVIVIYLVTQLTELPELEKGSELITMFTPSDPDAIDLKRDYRKRSSKHSGKKYMTASELMAIKFREKLNATDRSYEVPSLSPLMKKELDALVNDLRVLNNVSEHLVTQSVSWINGQEIVPRQGEPLLGSFLQTLKTLPVTSVDNFAAGNRLKLLVSFPSNLKAIFKPKWDSVDYIYEGKINHGQDQHFAEIAAFHVSLLLGLPRAPITVERAFNVQSEIAPVASPKLFQTITSKGNETCLYGVCNFCRPEKPVCTENGLLDGALILMWPEHMELKQYRHPWKRNYHGDKPASWDIDLKSEYCAHIASSEVYGRLLLDIIDASIFDFLIDNADRHHIEVFSETECTMLFIDNGKSFTNPHSDHIDIMAPLYQCCKVRSSTYDRLLALKGGTLTKYLSEMLQTTCDSTILVNAHLKAIERRLLFIFSAIAICIEERGKENVIVDTESSILKQ